MKLKLQLLAAADAFCRVSRRSESNVSKCALGHASALRRLRGGKDMLSGNVEAGLQWISDHWPEGEAWPLDVPRPAPSPSGHDLPPGDTASG